MVRKGKEEVWAGGCRQTRRGKKTVMACTPPMRDALGNEVRTRKSRGLALGYPADDSLGGKWCNVALPRGSAAGQVPMLPATDWPPEATAPMPPWRKNPEGGRGTAFRSLEVFCRHVPWCEAFRCHPSLGRTVPATAAIAWPIPRAPITGPFHAAAGRFLRGTFGTKSWLRYFLLSPPSFLRNLWNLVFPSFLFFVSSCVVFSLARRKRWNSC